MACGFALCGNGERYASDERNVPKKTDDSNSRNA